jgi:hypothetical protein
VPNAEDSTEFSEGTRQNTQMNETPDESISVDSATPPECPTVVQEVSSRESNRSDYKQQALRKRRRPNDLDPVDTCFIECMKQQTQANTPDPDGEFLHSLLPDVKTMNAKQKHMFKTGIVKLIDEILDNTESDGRSSFGLAEMSSVYSTTSTLNSLQEERDTSQSFSIYLEEN